MTRVLVAIHHTRPQYPSQKAAEEATGGATSEGVVFEAPIDLADRRSSGGVR